nr:proteoglycan 4-like [Nerophis lumbriciformis]
MSWTPLCSLFLLACALTPSVSQNSCRGRCGIEYYRGYLCQCDYSCIAYGECCLDFETYCTTKNSCRGRCGETFKRGQLCSCDSDCVKYKQCCPDYKIHCDAEEETVNEAEQPFSGANDEEEPESTSGYESTPAESLDPVSNQPTLITETPKTSTEAVSLAMTPTEDVESNTLDMADGSTATDDADRSDITAFPDSGKTSASDQISDKLTPTSALQPESLPATDTTLQNTAQTNLQWQQNPHKTPPHLLHHRNPHKSPPHLLHHRNPHKSPPHLQHHQNPHKSPPHLLHHRNPHKSPPHLLHHRNPHKSPPHLLHHRNPHKSPPHLLYHRNPHKSPPHLLHHRNPHKSPPHLQYHRNPQKSPPHLQYHRNPHKSPPRLQYHQNPPHLLHHQNPQKRPPHLQYHQNLHKHPRHLQFHQNPHKSPPYLLWHQILQDLQYHQIPLKHPSQPQYEQNPHKSPPHISPEPSQESPTPSVAPEPSKASSTSSVPKETSQDSSTISVPPEPSQESSKPSLSPEPSQASSTSSIPSEPSQASFTSSVPPDPSQEPSRSSVPPEGSQESTTLSVAPEPSQESSTPSVATKPSQESSAPSVEIEPSQESFIFSAAPESSQESSTPSVATKPSQESSAPSLSTAAESSEAPNVPGSTTILPPSIATTLVVATSGPSVLTDTQNHYTGVSTVGSVLDVTTTVNPSSTDTAHSDSTDDVTHASPSVDPVTETQKPTGPRLTKPTSKPQDEPKLSLTTTKAPTNKPAPKPVASAVTVDNSRDFQRDDNNDTNLCSGRPASAVTTLRNGTIVVFRGHYFWSLDRNRSPGPARDITQAWGVPSPIDTVFTRCNCQGKTYIFKGNQYWRFENNNLDPGYPKAVETGFDGLRGHITAALSVPQYRSRRESVYFFKRGGMVQKYSYKFGTAPSCNRKPHYTIYTVRHRMVRHAESLLGPTINIRTAWRGFPTTVTSAVSVPSYREPEGYRYYVFSRTKSYNIRMYGDQPVVASPRENPTAQNNFINCPKTL